jgi:transcriptional regulator with XRE-family HTH domain
MQTVAKVDVGGSGMSQRASMPADPAVDRLYRLVGERVRDAREGLKLTQEDLARSIGVARTSITNVEKGRQKLPLHQLHRIALVLRVDVRSLLPAPEELEHKASLVQVRVGGIEREVPAQTARAINDMLSEVSRGKR